MSEKSEPSAAQDIANIIIALAGRPVARRILCIHLRRTHPMIFSAFGLFVLAAAICLPFLLLMPFGGVHENIGEPAAPIVATAPDSTAPMDLPSLLQTMMDFLTGPFGTSIVLLMVGVNLALFCLGFAPLEFVLCALGAPAFLVGSGYLVHTLFAQ